MRLPGTIAFAVAITGFSASPAFAWHKHGCNGGTVGGMGVTTFTGPTTVTTTRSTFTGSPAFFGSTVATPTFVTGGNLFTTTNLVGTPTFVTGGNLFSNPGVVTTAAPTVTYYTTPGTTTASDAKLDQLITKLDLLIAKMDSNQTVPPDNGVPAPNVVQVAPNARLTALERHKATFEAHLQAGTLAGGRREDYVDARHQYEKGRAYEMKWKAANDEMEAKLKALKAIP